MPKYKKPLAKTKTVDDWKCPWCRDIHSIRTVLFSQQHLDTSHIVNCPTCKNELMIMPSIEFTCQPTIDGELVE